MGTIKCIGILTSEEMLRHERSYPRSNTSCYLQRTSSQGIYRGYKGLITGEIAEFKSQNVSNIIQLGGTILKPPVAKSLLRPKVDKPHTKRCSEKVLTRFVIIEETVHSLEPESSRKSTMFHASDCPEPLTMTFTEPIPPLVTILR